MKIALFFNPAAGRGRARGKRVEILEEVQRRSNELVVIDSDSAAHLTEKVAELSRSDFDRLIICGGDGTLHHAIQQADLDHASFAIVPLGSGDDFASAASIPPSVSESIRCAFEGEVRKFDVGLANSRRFLGGVSLGFDARVAERAASTRWLRGSLLYVISTLRELPSFRPLQISLEVDGRKQERVVTFVVAANSPRYGGGVLIAPEARLDDGMLDLVVIGEASKLDLLLTFPAAYRGGHSKKSFVSVERLREVTIDAEHIERLYADGEPIGTTPVTITLDESKLKLAVPLSS